MPVESHAFRHGDASAERVFDFCGRPLIEFTQKSTEFFERKLDRWRNHAGIVTF